METVTFKLNIRENRILLLACGALPVVTMHNQFMLVWFSMRNLCVMLLMVTHGRLVRSEIN